MNLGLLAIKVNISGIITLNELDWIVNHQTKFSRVEEATAIKMGRLLDSGTINIGCRLTN